MPSSVMSRKTSIPTPAKVHEINHRGKYFQCPGPAHVRNRPCNARLCCFRRAVQAGGSSSRPATPRQSLRSTRTWRSPGIVIRSTREVIAKQGRDPNEVKIFPGISVIVAPTDEEARLKFETCKKYRSPEGALALYCGWVGVDLSKIDVNEKLANSETNAIQGLLSYFAEADPDRDWTLQEAAEFISIGSVMPKFIGSPATVADQLEQWMEVTDCDGFNLVVANHPTGYIDFVNLVVPELQRRGRMRTHYDTSTLREHYFGRRAPAAFERPSGVSVLARVETVWRTQEIGSYSLTALKPFQAPARNRHPARWVATGRRRCLCRTSISYPSGSLIKKNFASSSPPGLNETMS